MYADNVLYASHNDPVEATRIQEDLDRVGEWCNQNFMMVNTSKSMCMFFGSGHRLSTLDGPNLTLNGVLLPVCTSYPYLGVELDGKLSLTPHVNRLKKSLGNKLYELSKLRKNMSTKLSLTVYKVMILPTFEYC